jgi:hypothetical protein
MQEFREGLGCQCQIMPAIQQRSEQGVGFPVEWVIPDFQRD